MNMSTAAKKSRPARLKKFTYSRLLRIYDAVNSDLLKLLWIGSVLALLAIVITIGLRVALGQDVSSIVPTLSGILAALGILLAYCFVHAGRRVSTVDVLLADVQTQVGALLLAIDRVRAGREATAFPETQSAVLAAALRPAIAVMDTKTYETTLGRVEDLMRIPTRYVSAFYAELRLWKARCSDAKSSPMLLSDEDVFLASYMLIKRGLLAASGLTDHDETEEFKKYEENVIESLNLVKRLARIEEGRRHLYTRHALHFTLEDMKSAAAKDARQAAVA